MNRKQEREYRHELYQAMIDCPSASARCESGDCANCNSIIEMLHHPERVTALKLAQEVR